MRFTKRMTAAAVGVTAAVAGSGTAAAVAVERDELERAGRDRPVVLNDSYISPLTETFGDVRVGRNVFVASNNIVRADPRRRICLGDETNLQDNVLMLALSGSSPSSYCGRRSTSTAERVSIAHQAEIRNSRIGNFTFIGFRARLRNVTVSDGAFVLHGATLSNVRIPRDRLVPVGAVIRTQREANALPRKAEANSEFQEEVLEVNKEFAEEYQDLYREEGFNGVTGAGPAPKTPFNRAGRSPRVGRGTTLEPFARLVGDVRLGAGGSVGRRTSIRADEGTPIVIGDNAEIEDRVTFHALSHTSLRIGDDLNTDDNVVFHGPLVVGNGLTIADDAVLFRANVGNDVTIGDSALVIGPADEPLNIPSGTQIPANAKITTQAQVDVLR